MKYEFRVGDYVEMVSGKIGYISDVKYSSDRNRCVIHVEYQNGVTVGFLCADDYFRTEEMLWKYHYEDSFKRIGKHDFAKKKNKIEPMEIPDKPFDFGYKDSRIMWDKINEIIDYINKNDVLNGE